MIIVHEEYLEEMQNPFKSTPKVLSPEQQKIEDEKAKRKAKYAHRGRLIGAGLSVLNDIDKYSKGKDVSVMGAGLRAAGGATVGGWVGKRIAGD